MKDESKTKRQLIQELAAVRQIVQEFAGSGGDATLLPETVYARVLKVSDEWFRTLVEHAPFGLSIMNEGKSFEYVNPQFIEMFGYTLEDIPDKDMWFLRAYPDEEYREMVKGIWDEDTRRASDAKDVFTRTFRVTTKRGDAKAIRFKKVQLPEGKQFYWYDDITAKLEAEEALRQSEARYRTVFENTGTATVMVEKDSIISMVNTEFENLSGYRKEEIAGKVSWEVFVDDEDRGRMAEYHRKRREGSGGVPREYEFRFVTREGEVKDVVAKVDLVPGTKKSVASLMDITLRKRVERDLRESEKKYRTLFEASHDAIMLTDKEGVLDCNAAALTMFGFVSKEELVGRHPVEFSPPTQADGRDSYEAANEHKREGIRKGFHSFEWLHKRKDGTEFPAEVVLNRLELEGRKVLQAIIRDITERKHAEEQIHALTQQLLKAQESERQMIARELHDRVGQSLSSVKISCETLFDDQPNASDEVRSKLLVATGKLQESITSIRDLAYDLRPPILDQLGLIRTVYQYCEDFSDKTGIKVDLYTAGVDGLERDFDTEINLYRVIQEALINIKKHAEAHRVTIRLVVSFPTIILRVEDDGKGFEVEKRLMAAHREKRMGLQSMAERVRLLKGRMTIISRPMKGTKILIEIPVHEKG